MGNNSSFKDLTRRVTLYLDGELSTEDERELLQEIQLNPQYVQLLSKEQNFKEFIKSRLQRKQFRLHLFSLSKTKLELRFNLIHFILLLLSKRCLGKKL